ncbi:MAG: aminoglycoside phosphotransferase family protein [Eubacteriales bacterium]|nr:aminoglycoside phosphotransferase family protein [Eubacteriales bacterium]
MISRTKFEMDETSILRLFADVGISDATQAKPLGDGEFNAVYLVTTQQARYVLKIAPLDSAPVMTYERNMMQSEVFWYDIMRNKTTIRVPNVVCSDFSRTLLPVPFFIMEYLPGEPLNQATLTPDERKAADAQLIAMAAQLHAISNSTFGYPQCGQYDTWYDAIHAFVDQALSDCARKKRRSRRGERLLRSIERYRDLLLYLSASMVNFDIWPANIIVTRENDATQLSWIDPERSFWGDYMLDFVCFAFHRPLREKEELLAAYRAVAVCPISFTREQEIRFAIGQAYLALIMETEKYYRYSLFNFGWWRNVFACRFLYRAAFDVLEQ